MRTAYQHQLETLKRGLQDLLQQATHNLQLATSALLNADLSAAEQVISGADKLSVDAHEMAVLSFDLLALQAPVASDLRQVVSAMNSVNDARHMTMHALHIADLARDHHPDCCVPDEAIDLIESMAKLATAEGHTAVQVLDELDIVTARWLSERHLRMHDYREAALALVRTPSCTFSPRQAADLALLAHYLERFGDYAVDAAQRVIYLVTGEDPELDELAEATQEAAEHD
ncbi:MAG: phosphate uptake regulator PhoU [Lawsonella sp.]|uniref:phosphate signaling complex PhoU family protein n=1 Tax=Lawsonella sp. TaxID=2041415 RepID=UPI002A757A9E|nr:phosphate uptake regulator PhoU [Lawsonella sp.]MDY2978897.1 phosphate uptake regulator PhoU [Lawsonella sp.]